MSDDNDQVIIDETPNLVANGLASVRAAITAIMEGRHEELETKIKPDDEDIAKAVSDKLSPQAVPDGLLLRFLRSMKFDGPKAANHFLAYRRRKAELFPSEALDTESPLKMDDEILATLSQGVLVVPLGVRDKDGHQMLFFRPRLFNYDEDCMSPEKFARAHFAVLDRMLALDEQTQKCGLCMVGIAKGISMSNFRRQTSKLIMENVQDKLPLRVGRAFIVDQPMIFSVLFKIVKLFMKEKLKRRIKVLGSNHKELLKYMDPSSIPEEAGGKLKIDKDAFIASLRE